MCLLLLLHLNTGICYGSTTIINILCGRNNLTSVDVRFWSLKMVPAIKRLMTYWHLFLFNLAPKNIIFAWRIRNFPHSTAVVLYSAQYHRQHYTLQDFEQSGAQPRDLNPVPLRVSSHSRTECKSLVWEKRWTILNIQAKQRHLGQENWTSGQTYWTSRPSILDINVKHTGHL